MTAKRVALLAVAFLAGARGGAAQEPAGPPPPSSRVEDRGTAVLELLPGAARAGPPAAPFPVRRQVRTRLRVLEVAPFCLKYTVTALDHLRLRPYASAGADVVVVVTRQTPEQDESLLFRGTSPFDGPLLGGLVSQAPHLQARGIPPGPGDFRAGF